MDLAFKLCLALGALRLVNAELSLGLNLRDFPFGNIIGLDYSPVSQDHILQQANSRSAVDVDFERMQAEIGLAVSRIGDDFKYCGGHDILGAAAALLRKGGAKSVGAHNLASSLFTATDCDSIRRLPLRVSISNWACFFFAGCFRMPLGQRKLVKRPETRVKSNRLHEGQHGMPK